MLQIRNDKGGGWPTAPQQHREKFVRYRKAIGRDTIQSGEHPPGAPLMQGMKARTSRHSQAVDQQRVRILCEDVREMLVFLHFSAEVVDPKCLRDSSDRNDRLAGHARRTDVR